MDPAITSALVGVGGIVLGVVLTAANDARTRRKVGLEQREQARHARELIAVEYLDEALVNTSRALDAQPEIPLEERYANALAAWTEGWVTYSPRVREPRVLARYETVGSLLQEVVTGARTTKEFPRHVIARATGNARATIGHFLRDEQLPDTAFPEPDELSRLLAEGDSIGIDGDPAGPLKHWLDSHPTPQFHADDIERALGPRQGCSPNSTDRPVRSQRCEQEPKRSPNDEREASFPAGSRV